MKADVQASTDEFRGIARDPASIIIAHVMDPTRRELYVEGARDRNLFIWLTRNTRSNNVLIREIAEVLLNGPTNGNKRSKLVSFAKDILGKPCNIRLFADADFDRVLGRQVPDNIWLTDKRDLEGYFLRKDSLDKILALAVCKHSITPDQIIENVRKVGRELGILRLLSEQHALKLPFQSCHSCKYLSRDGDIVTLAFDNYFTALLQNAGISLNRKKTILADYNNTRDTYINTPDDDIVHGKDVIAILQCLLV